MKDFIKYTEELDDLIKIDNPTEKDYEKLENIISDDKDLAIYFYRENTNPGWFDRLHNAGQFKKLSDDRVADDLLTRMKAFYLVEVSKERPKEVLDLINELDVKDWFIQGILLQTLLAKPLEIVDEGTELIKKYLNKPYRNEWHVQGEHCAEFMVKIASDYPEKAFEIARILLEMRKSVDEKHPFDRVETRFRGFDYKRLLFDYCKKLWEIYPFETTKLLIDIFNNYLKELVSDDYSVQSGFHTKIERLDQIETGYAEDNIRNIIQAICESGKQTIENESEQTETLLNYLEELKKPIFKRIEMYLLRFVPKDGQIDRVNAIIGDKKYLDYIYDYEYKLLLHDRFENISKVAKKVFIDWIKEKQVPDDDIERFAGWFKKINDRAYTDEDLKRYEDRQRAKKLYLLREKGEFKELYEKYRNSSEKSDKELAPKPKESEARWMSGKEGAPLNAKEMFEMNPVDAIEYINDPSKWIIDKNQKWYYNTPEEAMPHVFEDVVKANADDYIVLGLEELQKIKPKYLQRYFNGIVNVFREKDLQKESLITLLENSKSIIDANIESTDYESTFRLILEIIEKIFGEVLKKSIVQNNGQLIWGIIENLRNYNDERPPESDLDAYSECINTVSGKAFTLIVRFGLFFKNLNEADYNANWSGILRSCFEDVIEHEQRRWVRCILGVNFPQIRYLEKRLAEEKVDVIFDVNNQKMWRDVWGQYLSWSRAYKKIFMFLYSKGKYTDSIKTIGTYGEKRAFAIEVDEGLAQHLMIAYFNGWIEWGDSLLIGFFEKAPAELRGKAANFLQTGFKPTRDEKIDYERRKQRIRVYWTDRLEKIRPEVDKEEAVELISWVEDSLLEEKETLKLTLKTLEKTGGKVSQHRGENVLVKAVCKIGVHNELLALKCLNKMMDGKPEWLSVCLYKNELGEFLKHVVELARSDKNIKNEAIKLIIAYFRRNVKEFKPYYDMLVGSE